MASLRPGKCYRKWEKPYTRVSRKKSKNYIQGAPKPRINKFLTGNKDREFKVKILLIGKEKVQIRDNALESARVAANNFLVKKVGKEGYRLRLIPYPHQILREHPIYAGAGADRFQEGMRHPFGRPIGRAVRANKGQELFKVQIGGGREKIARKALKKASYKLPVKVEIKDVSTKE